VGQSDRPYIGRKNTLNFGPVSEKIAESLFHRDRVPLPRFHMRQDQDWDLSLRLTGKD